MLSVVVRGVGSICTLYVSGVPPRDKKKNVDTYSTQLSTYI